ncbi:hypothetical protein LCGC14_2208470, partial [marine sediment metagenome]
MRKPIKIKSPPKDPKEASICS